MLLPNTQPTHDRYLARLLPAVLVAICLLSTTYCYMQGLIIIYGDAESHLNIAKRVVSSLTPGLAQLGGIWLPLPHLLMTPFVAIEPLYRTGLAGAIVSGFAFCISGLYIYKTGKLLTGSMSAALVATAIFALNPNILYLQSTPMTELPLIVCFILSTYYFIKFVQNDTDTLALIGAALFGFLATLMRYDGWFLVLFEALGIAILYSLRVWEWRTLEGKVILFGTLAFFGIALWLAWDFLILGDPLYFTNSPFSAKSQQNGWAARGQLPSYHNIGSSLAYYTVTSAVNSGVVIFGIAVVGLLVYLLIKPSWQKVAIVLVLLVPYIFYVATLYMGQSIILIPELTPASFISTIFNVRYGTVMIPTIALFAGYLFKYRSMALRGLIVLMVAGNLAAFFIGQAPVITLDDGRYGLSRMKTPDAENFISKSYDGGLILLDDYAKVISIIKSGLPMQNVIYIGNKPYWEDGLRAPQHNIRWIIMQRDDAVWSNFLGQPAREAELYKYYEKVYTSPDVLIFRRNSINN
jgi:hypothetical protein